MKRYKRYIMFYENPSAGSKFVRRANPDTRKLNRKPFHHTIWKVVKNSNIQHNCYLMSQKNHAFLILSIIASKRT
jgi:hypothetical protein